MLPQSEKQTEPKLPPVNYQRILPTNMYHENHEIGKLYRANPMPPPRIIPRTQNWFHYGTKLPANPQKDRRPRAGE